MYEAEVASYTFVRVIKQLQTLEVAGCKTTETEESSQRWGEAWRADKEVGAHGLNLGDGLTKETFQLVQVSWVSRRNDVVGYPKADKTKNMNTARSENL